MGSTKLTVRREQVNSEGQCTVYVYYGHQDDRCYFSTHEQVPIKNWDFKNSRVKSSYRGYTILNELLLKKKGEIDDIKRKLIIDDIEPTVDMVRTKRTNQLGPAKPKLSFFQIYDQFIEHKEEIERVSFGTMKQYRSFKERLMEFEKIRRKRIALSHIDMKFYHEFLDYLELDLEMRANTAGNQIKHIKSFINWCSLNGFEVNDDFRKFKKPKNNATIVALTHDEFEKLWNHTFESKSLERVRDAFIFSCSTGLRFSDYSSITKDNVVTETINGEPREFIKKYMKKTEEEVSMPLNQHSRTILTKYDFNLRILSNQKMNTYLKKAAKEARLTGVREILINKARKMSTVNKPLYDIISSHCGRKTFATLSLDGGIPVHTVMAITAHRYMTSFQRYMAHNKSSISDAMEEKWNFK